MAHKFTRADRQKAAKTTNGKLTARERTAKARKAALARWQSSASPVREERSVA